MIITSYLFPEARFSLDRLKAVLQALDGNKDKLVIDLSCRRQGDRWVVAINKWQTLSDLDLNEGEQNEVLIAFSLAMVNTPSSL